MHRLREALQWDFDAAQFRQLPARQQAEICTKFAERAQQLAADAHPEESAILMNIAKEWLHLGGICGGKEDCGSCDDSEAGH